ncbi:hypothetical protein D3C75_617990 [compost metagenome]
MYCGNCGAELNTNDRFCGECGHAANFVPQVSVDRNASGWVMPKITMSRTAKIVTSISSGLIVLIIATYSILHYTYGPATPEKLESKLQEAVAARNVDKLLGYLDDSNQSMRQAEIVGAFQKAFNDETASGYEYYFREALYREQQGIGSDDPDEKALIGNTPVYFKKEKNWRGTKWTFNVLPTAVTFEKGDNWTASSSLETLENGEGVFDNLWPAVYSYQSEVSNLYGGKETVQGSIDLLGGAPADIYLSDRLQSSVVLSIPAFKNINFKLNGVELPRSGDMQTVRITPKPAEMNVEVTGTYLGKTINQSLTLDASNTGEYELDTLVKQSVADEVANLLLDANVSWTKAINSANPALLTGLDPEGDAYQSFSHNIATAQDKPKVHLVRIGFVPSSVELSEDQIQVTTAEEYSYLESDISNNTASNTYHIAQKPNSDSWWIVSSGQNYFWGDDIFNREDSLVKINQED